MLNVTLENAQSLIQLSVALNGAYFSFKSANQITYAVAADLEKKASSLAGDAALIRSKELKYKINDLSYKYKAHIWREQWFNKTISKVMLPIGYSLAILSIFLLLISTLFPENKVSGKAVIIYFLLFFGPVLGCVLYEIFISYQVNRLSKNFESVIESAREQIIATETGAQ